jgi:hypothetical protein
MLFMPFGFPVFKLSGLPIFLSGHDGGYFRQASGTLNTIFIIFISVLD